MPTLYTIFISLADAAIVVVGVNETLHTIKPINIIPHNENISAFVRDNSAAFLWYQVETSSGLTDSLQVFSQMKEIPT